MAIFRRKKTQKRAKRPELRVVEGVDFRSRKRELSKIFRYRNEMFPEDVEVYEGRKKSLSTY